MICSMSDATDGHDRHDAQGHTRRWLLQAGAGAALGAVGLGAGVFAQPAQARQSGFLGDEFVPKGTLRLVAFKLIPEGWAACDGEQSGDPDLRGRAAAGAGRTPSGRDFDVGDHGRGLAVGGSDGDAGTLALTYLVSLEDQAGQPMIGEVRAFGFPFAPPGFEICDGRKLPVPNFTPLFALIGDTFGGDGRREFGVPDMRGRTPLSHGHGPGLPAAPYAERRNNVAGGAEGRDPRLHVNYCIATHRAFPRRRS